MAIDASFPAWYQEEIRSWRQPSGLLTGFLSSYVSGVNNREQEPGPTQTHTPAVGDDGRNERIKTGIDDFIGKVEGRNEEWGFDTKALRKDLEDMYGVNTPPNNIALDAKARISGILDRSGIPPSGKSRSGNWFYRFADAALGKASPNYMSPADQATVEIRKQQMAQDLWYKTNSLVNDTAEVQIKQQQELNKSNLKLLNQGAIATFTQEWNRLTEAGQMDTPEAGQRLNGIILKNPSIAADPAIKGAMEMWENSVGRSLKQSSAGTVTTKDLNAARDLEAQADEFEANGDLTEADRLRADATAIRENVSRRGMDTSSQKLLQARKWLTEAQAAQKAGDTELAETLKSDAQALRQSLAPKGTTFEVFDDNGQLKFRMGQGVTGGSDATTATKTDVQKQELASESAVSIGTQLLGSLDESMVGARGFWNENVVNEGLAQVFPNLSKDEVTSGRSLMRAFSERVIKSIKADSQLNAQERKALESALPQFGVMESLPSAKQKIKTFVNESKRITRDNAKRLKNPVPLWALTPAEIQDKLRKKEITVDQFKEAVTQGFTKEDFQ